jgi:hypothetical protein
LPFFKEKASGTFFFGFSIIFVWIKARVENRLNLEKGERLLF